MIVELRKKMVTGPLLKKFRKVLPPLSRTEEEALNAGTVWWDAELFSGRPDWNRLLSLPAPALTHEERQFLDGPVEELCAMLDDWKITHEEMDLSEAVWQFIREKGFFGMIIPRRYGGLEFSALAHSDVVMKLASRSITAAVTVMVPNSLGPAKLLLQYGTDEQRKRYLPGLANGTEIPCFALTGPRAGSDAGSIPDRGVVGYGTFGGRRILGIRLNWEKRYITLAPVATLIGLAFRLEDPDCLLSEDTAPGITLALIPRDTPGIEIGRRHLPLDIAFMNGPIRGRDVFVPIDWVIGGQQGLGQGWRMLVECLAEGRGISLPALATGAGKLASRYTGAYARIRQQFHKPIGYFEGVEAALARIAAFTYKMDAARLLTLSALDSGERPSVISAMIKYHLTESYRQVINDAMDVQGGSGICLGPNNLFGRVYQAVPISITVEGANILTRSMIIFGQGAVRCHPFILKEMRAAHEKVFEKALDRFDRAIFGHLVYLLGNLARSLLYGISRGRFSRTPVKGPASHYYRKLNWMSSAFALCADAALMTLGGALKRKERLSARLGDIFSELYLASAVLKHFHDQGCHEDDLPLLQWACEDSLYRIQEAFRSLFRNFPSPFLAGFIRLLVFPGGMPFNRPCDGVDHQAARSILSASPARQRLTDGIYVTRNPAEKMGQLELGLDKVEKTVDSEGTLRCALRSGLITGDTLESLLEQARLQGLLTEAEAEELEDMERLRGQIIGVDSFRPQGIKPSQRLKTQEDRHKKAAPFSLRTSGAGG